MEERRQREAQISGERTRREEELARQQERYERDMQERMGAMMRLVENVGKNKPNSKERLVKGCTEGSVVLS